MLKAIAWRGFSLVYGVFNLVSMVAVAYITEAAFLKQTSKEDKRELAIAQKRYWTLDNSPLPGFTHHFFTLRNGTQLHYVANAPSEPSTAKNVAIFIHGFPDSFLLWRSLLTSSALRSYTLIAVDLPGYGGSDALPMYGPNEVLETVTEFILGIRAQFLKEEAKMVVVGHDWGGIVTARLGSEASQLADRWIIASGCIPQLGLSNVTTRVKSATQMLHTWIHRPFNISLLKNAFNSLKPVLAQLGLSFYTFCFNLPYPLSNFYCHFGGFWLLRSLHNVSAGLFRPTDGTFIRKLNTAEAADYLAMTAGPGVPQFEESQDKSSRYPEAVRKRMYDYGLVEKIRLYREGLFFAPWEKSLETVVGLSEIPDPISRIGSRASGTALFDDGPPGSMKRPATFIIGEHDPGLDKRLAFEGMEDYLIRESQVMTIGGAGHWLPFEELGSEVLEEIIEWALGDEKKSLKSSLESLSEVKFLLEK